MLSETRRERASLGSACAFRNRVVAAYPRVSAVTASRGLDMRRLLLLLLAPAVVAQPWQSLGVDPTVSGFNGPVYAVATTPGGGYWVGGAFTEAPGGVPAWRLARWDGTRWSGPATGPDGPVITLALAAEGSVVVGGSFGQVGDLAANHIARWTGTLWEALGEGTPLPVLSVAVGPDGSVVAGGEFKRPGRNLARWNGTAWDRIGGGVGSIVTGPPNAGPTEAGPIEVGLAQAGRQSSAGDISYVASLVYGADGALYAGGSFSFVGSGRHEDRAGSAARWDGAEWTTLGASIPEHALFFGRDVVALPSGGALFGGYARRRDGQKRGLVEGDAQGFRYVYPQVTNVQHLAVGPAGRVLVAGEWEGGEGVGWVTGGSVEPLATPTAVYDLAVESDGTVMVAGRGVGPQPGGVLYRRDGAGWSRDGLSTDQSVLDLAVGAYGELWAAGGFTVIGTTPAWGLASWDGARWRAADVPGADALGTFEQVAIGPDGRVAALAVPGYGGGPPSVAVRSLAGTWTVTAPLPPSSVTSLAWTDDGIAVSGGFYGLGTTVARWTGTEWVHSLPGVQAWSLAVRAGRLVAVVVRDDGTREVVEEVAPGEWVALDAPSGVRVVGASPDGTLFAGGYQAIHTLRGGAWTTAPVRESVSYIEPGPDGTALVATARYNTRGARGTVYRVDGATAEVVAETDGPIRGVVQHGGALVLGGEFHAVDGDAAAYVVARADARAPIPPTARAPLEVIAAPNPTRGDLTVAVPVTAPGPVRVEVFDALGRRLAVLHDGQTGVGLLTVSFDARTLAPGLYVVRAQVGADVASRSVTVVG